MERVSDRGRKGEQKMQTTLAVEDIKVSLPELLDSLSPGDEVILTRNHRRVAKLVSETPKPRQPRQPGNCKGMITLLVEDDEHLEGFAEHMS
jgi:antitoxin (DNA-binding transcriptional repressor) of toxin-antitoxin stability system